MYKKQWIASTVLLVSGVCLVSNASATAEWAELLNVGCEICHKSSLGNERNVKSAAKAAYNQASVFPGLKNYVAEINNHKPVISPIALEWDAEANHDFSLPLSVFDEEVDAFESISKLPLGAEIKDADDIDDHGLPVVHFQWRPSDAQANKTYKLSFKAKEKVTKKKLTSVPIVAKIRVWPQGDRNATSVSAVIVSTSKWSNGLLTLKGKVALNKLLTATEKTEFLSRPDWTVNISQGRDGSGIAISHANPITLNPQNGSFTLENIPMPADTAFSCNLTLDFQGKRAARSIAGAPSNCIR